MYPPESVLLAQAVRAVGASASPRAGCPAGSLRRRRRVRRSHAASRHSCVLRALHLHGRSGRRRSREPRGERLRRGYLGAVHERSRRSNRRTRPLVEVHHVRGFGRRPADFRGSRHSPRKPRDCTGLSGRRLPDDRRRFAAARRAGRDRSARRLRYFPLHAASGATNEKFSANFMRWVRSRECSCCARGLTSSCTTRVTSRSYSISKLTPANSAISPRIRVTPRCARAARQNCAEFVDPDEVDRQAKEDQARRLELAGGAEVVEALGDRFAYSPAPEQFRYPSTGVPA